MRERARVAEKVTRQGVGVVVHTRRQTGMHMTIAIIVLVIALTMVYVFGVQVLNRLDRIAEAISGKSAEEARLWCARGVHHIGNEPYTFIGDGADDAGEPVCLRCVARVEKSIQERLQEVDEQKAKAIEWNNLAEEEREIRRVKAKANGVCPRCNELLTPKGSCPMCFEYPFNIRAPMNRVWREREREGESLSESEKQPLGG
jgi:uncharacterized paraquat-inducible protein A